MEELKYFSEREREREEVMGRSIFLARSFSVLAFVIGSAAYGDTIGSPLVQRALKDVNSGQVYIYDGSTSPFLSDGVASTWSFYDASSAGGVVTPLLFREISNNTFVLTGIGTTRVSNASGVQTYSFDLIAGSDAVVGESYTFGFTNRTYTISAGNLTAGGSTAGVVPHDSPTLTTDQWLETATAAMTTGGVPVTLSIGSEFGSVGTPFFDNGGGKQRVYSAQLTVAPEPTCAALFYGAGMMLLLRRARKAV